MLNFQGPLCFRQDLCSIAGADLVEASREHPPGARESDHLGRAGPALDLLDDAHPDIAESRSLYVGTEIVLVGDDRARHGPVGGFRQGRQPVPGGAVDDRLGQAGRLIRDGGGEAAAGSEDAAGLGQGAIEIGNELEAVPAGDGVEARVGESKLFHVHELEAHRKAGGRSRLGGLQHPRRQVDPHRLAVRSHPLGQLQGDGARTTGQVEDAVSGSGLNRVDQEQAGAQPSLPPQVVLALLVAAGVAREYRGKEFLGLHAAFIQRLVSYLVRSTPSGNVRVSTRFRFTQLSRAVKNGVPPPTRTGWVTIAYSSISPARMAAAARVAPPTSMGPPSSVLSRMISVTASPVTRRAFQSTALVGEEDTTFGMARQRRANSICAGVAPGCWSAVGQWELIVSHSLRPYSARPVAPTRSDHHLNSSSLGTLQPRSSPGAAM